MLTIPNDPQGPNAQRIYASGYDITTKVADIATILEPTRTASLGKADVQRTDELFAPRASGAALFSKRKLALGSAQGRQEMFPVSHASFAPRAKLPPA